MKQIFKRGENMKKITLILILLSAVSFLFLLTGCEEDSGMSIEDRIKAFVSDLNDSSRNGIFKEHFHPDSTSYTNGSEATIEPVFPNDGGETYTQTSISGSGSSRTVYIDCTGDDGVDGNYTFTMKEDGEDDWYILSINPGGLN